jgi:hypothetical protein
MQVAKWYSDSKGFNEAERGAKMRGGVGGSRVHIGESAKK